MLCLFPYRGEYEYELWLRYDLYTSKRTQWFYFSVQNTRPNSVYLILCLFPYRGEYEYELWLRYDLYTSKHTQWFYFSVQNTGPNSV